MSSPITPWLHVDMTCWTIATLLMFGFMFHQMYAFHCAPHGMIIPPSSPQRIVRRRMLSRDPIQMMDGHTGNTPILQTRSPELRGGRMNVSMDVDTKNIRPTVIMDGDTKQHDVTMISSSPVIRVRPSIEDENKQMELTTTGTPIIRPTITSGDPPSPDSGPRPQSHQQRPTLPPLHDGNMTTPIPPMSPSHNKYTSPRLGPRQGSHRISIDVISPRVPSSHNITSPNIRTPSRLNNSSSREAILPYRFHILCSILTLTLPFQLINWAEEYYPPSAQAEVLQIITASTAHLRTVCLAFAGMYLTYVSMDGLYVAISSTGSPRIVAWSHIAVVSLFVICSTISCIMMFVWNRGWPDVIWCIAQTIGMIFVFSVFTYAIHVFTRQLDAQSNGIHVMSPQLITRFQRMKRAMTYVRIVLIIAICTEIYIVYDLLQDFEMPFLESSHSIMFSEWCDLVFGAWIRWYWWKKLDLASIRTSSVNSLSGVEA